MPGGRPTDYTPELGAEICSRLAEGVSLRTVCLADDMPSRSTVFLWLMKHQEFSDQYTRASNERGDAIYEDTLEIADDGRNDWMARQSESEKGAGVNNGWVLNGEHVQRSRLRVETRKWFLSKLNPKKYGDKQTVEHTDPNGNNPFAPLMEIIGASGRPRPGSGS